MNTYSEPLPVYNGIPQGSTTGPILFGVMVNNLAEDIPLRWKFVDDMTLLEVARKNIKSSPLEILEDIATEALKNKMHVNPLKSTILTINFLSTAPSFTSILQSQIIRQEIKLLGVTITF
jgi:hypothetical protein